MYDWVEKSKFDRLGIFTYSHEENTSAYAMTDDVPQNIKQARANKIMELQAGISHELNQNKVGKEYKVLIDKEEGDYYIGRSEFDSPDVDNEVKILKKHKKLILGDFVNVKVNSADFFDLHAIPI
jgi:2-methylthioadenine synthetase